MTNNRIKINDILKTWVNGFWFAPDNLKKAILSADNINGVYIPFWTFDTETYTDYKGERGDAYYETVGSGKDRKRVDMLIGHIKMEMLAIFMMTFWFAEV